MPRSSLRGGATLVVVALVLLSGCSSLVQSGTTTVDGTTTTADGESAGSNASDQTDGGTTTPSTAVPAETDAPGPSTTTVTATTDAPDADSDSDSNAEAGVSWKTLLKRHNERLHDAKSWTGRYTVSYDGAAGGLQQLISNRTTVVRVEGDERYSKTTLGKVSVSMYTASADAPVYVRKSLNGSAIYSKRETVREVQRFARPVDPGDERDYRLTDHGVVETDHGQREKYTFDNETAIQSAVDGLQGSIENASFTVFVDPDTDVVTRIVSEIEMTRDGEPITVTATVTITNVGETTVDEPDWLDEAKDRTG